MSDNYFEDASWSVSELNLFIKELFNSNVLPFWLHGEISNLLIHNSGHVYLTLKDKKSQVSAVLWNGSSIVRHLQLVDGQEVEVFGELGIYEPRGTYQIIVKKIRLSGEGKLKKKFEQLKLKLEKEGVFSPERKRPIPQFPQTIGIVTSLEGAALHDFLQIIRRRFSNLKIIISPASVQGKLAVSEIVQAIQRLNRYKQCEVIVITRGGGSIEDLQAFNEEEVARAIIASQIPTVSAIGHEIDVSISDLVADLRASTPSAAAELISTNSQDLHKQLNQTAQRFHSSMQYYLKNYSLKIEQFAQNPFFKDPQSFLYPFYQRLDEFEQDLTYLANSHQQNLTHQLQTLVLRLQNKNPQEILLKQEQNLNQLSDRFNQQIKNQIQSTNNHINSLSQQLNQLSPTKVLERGYAILRNKKQQIIHSINQVETSEIITAQVLDGKITLSVSKQ